MNFLIISETYEETIISKKLGDDICFNGMMLFFIIAGLNIWFSIIIATSSWTTVALLCPAMLELQITLAFY